MPNNYKHYVFLMCDRLTDIVDHPRLIEPRCNSSQCVTDKRSYEYEVVDNADNVVCTIPAMTDQGFFIIQGEQKVQLIQEVRLRTEHFLSDNPPCCICNIMNSVVPVKIRISNRSLIQLDTFMIHRDLRGVKVISVYELLFQVFPTDDNIRELIMAYCNEDDLTDMCAWYILSSGTVGASGLDIDEYRETIRSKLFNNMNNFSIVMTVISMTVQCVQVMHGLCDVSDRDHYALKHLRTPGEIFYSMFQACIKSSKINLQSAVQAHIYSCLRRGEVVINGRTHDKMAAQLSKRSPIDAISSVRKVIVPCDENSPNMAMRQIHTSQTGYICPCETPEGRSVGIIKHLAATASYFCTRRPERIHHACVHAGAPHRRHTHMDYVGWCSCGAMQRRRCRYDEASPQAYVSIRIVRAYTQHTEDKICGWQTHQAPVEHRGSPRGLERHPSVEAHGEGAYDTICGPRRMQPERSVSSRLRQTRLEEVCVHGNTPVCYVRTYGMHGTLRRAQSGGSECVLNSTD